MKPVKKRPNRYKKPAVKFYLKIVFIIVLFFVPIIIYGLFQFLGAGFVSPIPLKIGDFNLAKIQRDKDSIASIEEALRNSKIDYLFVTNGVNNSYLITLEQNSEVLINNTNIESQISSLQKISKRLTMEGKKIKSLDLRYSKPVIVIY